MASWREIERIRKNPEAFRALAKQLLVGPVEGLTEWETTFLESVSQKVEIEEFSNRQGEKLLQIRDGAQSIQTFRSFSIKSLIKGCFEARLDLSEDDEQWITAVRERSPASIKLREAGRLMRCACQLDLVEDAVLS